MTKETNSTLPTDFQSESSHTPGPWHWDSDPVKGDPTGRIRYRVCTTGKTITQVYYSSFEGGHTNAVADAKLIAAAPDLLEALKKAASELEQYVDFQQKSDYLEYAADTQKKLDAINAIIAKAEGRS
jgi:hypothetical protein